MSRNNILIEIAKEYTEIHTVLKKTVQDIETELEKAGEDISAINTDLANNQALLRITSPGATQYHLECQRKSLLSRRQLIREHIVELDKAMHAAKGEITKHDYAFVSQNKRVQEDYKIRSDKYARIAIKAIEKKGLKYEISTLRQPSYWINNPLERSTI